MKKIITKYEDFINEIFQPINTDFEIKYSEDKNGLKTETYIFKTKLGYSYDVYFYITPIDNEYGLRLSDGRYLNDYLKKIPDVFVEIGFTKSETEKSLDFVKYHSNFIERTNRKEQYEVLNKIIYIVDYFIKNNPSYIYVIGNNTFKSNLNVYNEIYHRLFSKLKIL